MLLCSASLNAALVQFEVGGVVTQSSNLAGVNVGDPFSILYAFEASQSGTTYTGRQGSREFQYTDYIFNTETLGWTLTVGDHFFSTPATSSAIISTRNDAAVSGSGTEQYYMSTEYTSSSFEEFFFVSLYSTSGNTIDPVNLLLSSPNLSMIERK